MKGKRTGAKSAQAKDAPIEADVYFAKLHDEGEGNIRGKTPRALVRDLKGKDGDQLRFRKLQAGEAVPLGAWVVDIKSEGTVRRGRKAHASR